MILRRALLPFAAALILFNIALADDAKIYQIASRAYNDKAYNFAVLQFNKIINTYPSSSYLEESFYYSALCYFYLNKKEKSEQVFRQNLNFFPASPKAIKSHYYIALINYEDKLYDIALNEVRDGIKLPDYDNFRDLLKILAGDIFISLGKHEEAVKEYLSVSQTSVHLSEYKLGRIYYTKGEYEKAENSFSRVLQSPSTDYNRSEVYYYKIKSIFMRKDFTRAEKEFSDYLNKYPDSAYSADIRFYKNYMPFEKKDYNLCIINLENLLKAYPDTPYTDMAYYYIGRSYELINQKVLAVEYYYKLINNKPESAYSYKALYNLYKYYDQKGDLQKAAEALDKLSSTGNEEYLKIALKEKAFFYLNTGDIRKAEENFNELLEKYPDFEGSLKEYEWFSSALQKSGEYEKANRILEKALKALDSDSGDISKLSIDQKEAKQSSYIFQKAENLINLGNYTEAQKYLTLIFNEYPGSEKTEFARESLAWILFINKKYEEALKEYKKLHSSENNEIKGIAFFRSGLCHYNLGRKDQAESDFLTLYNSWPENRYYNDCIELLGKIKYQNNKYSDALGFYKQLFTRSENTEQKITAAYWTGWCYYRLDKRDEAFTQLITLKEISLDSIYTWDAMLLAGKIRYNSKDYSSAKKIYTEIINNQKRITDSKIVSDALYDLGMCYMQLSDYVQAKFYFTELTNQFPDKKKTVFYARLSLAEGLYTKKLYKEAAAEYLLLTDMALNKKDKISAYYWAGLCSEKALQKENSLEYYQQVISETTHHLYWDALYRSALIYQQLGQTKKANSYFDTIKNNSNRQDLVSVITRQETVKQQRELKQEISSTQDIESLLELLKIAESPEDKAGICFKLAGLYELQKNTENALTYYKLVTDYASDLKAAQSQYKIAYYYYSKSDFNQAYHNFMTYFYLYDGYEQESAELLFYTGESAYRTKNYNDAGEFLQRLIKKFPLSEYSKQAEKYLKYIEK